MKNKNYATSNDIHEDAVVRHDFIYVVILNALLFGLMLGLYFWNQSTGTLNSWFESVIKF